MMNHADVFDDGRWPVNDPDVFYDWCWTMNYMDVSDKWPAQPDAAKVDRKN